MAQAFEASYIHQNVRTANYLHDFIFTLKKKKERPPVNQMQYYCDGKEQGLVSLAPFPPTLQDISM